MCNSQVHAPRGLPQAVIRLMIIFQRKTQNITCNRTRQRQFIKRLHSYVSLNEQNTIYTFLLRRFQRLTDPLQNKHCILRNTQKISNGYGQIADVPNKPCLRGSCIIFNHSTVCTHRYIKLALQVFTFQFIHITPKH